MRRSKTASLGEKMRLRTALLAALFGVCGIFGCGDSAGNGGDDKIVIAVAGPITGSAAAFGEMIRKAAELKEKEVNDAGGINGRMVEFQIEDDKGLAAEATSVSRKLSADANVLAVVGHFNSDCSLAGKTEYNRVGLVQFSPGSTNVDVCQGGDWTFRNLYRDDQQGIFLANFAMKALELKRVAIVFEQDNYGTGLKEAFEAEAARIGLEIVASESYQRGRTQDFTPHMTNVKQAEPDGVFISGLYNEAALIVKTAKNDLGLDLPFFGGDGLDSPDLIETGGEAAEGMYITSPFIFGTDSQTAEVTAFYDSFKAMHGNAPDTWAALTWDACGQILDAIAKAGADRQKIRDHLAAQATREAGYSGITGVTYFDANGDCVGKPIYVKQVIDGGFGVSPEQLLED